jgi:hypothetical protein
VKALVEAASVLAVEKAHPHQLKLGGGGTGSLAGTPTKSVLKGSAILKSELMTPIRLASCARDLDESFYSVVSDDDDADDGDGQEEYGSEYDSGYDSDDATCPPRTAANGTGTGMGMVLPSMSVMHTNDTSNEDLLELLKTLCALASLSLGIVVQERPQDSNCAESTQHQQTPQPRVSGVMQCLCEADALHVVVSCIPFHANLHSNIRSNHSHSPLKRPTRPTQTIAQGRHVHIAVLRECLQLARLVASSMLAIMTESETDSKSTDEGVGIGIGIGIGSHRDSGSGKDCLLASNANANAAMSRSRSTKSIAQVVPVVVSLIEYTLTLGMGMDFDSSDDAGDGAGGASMFRGSFGGHGHGTERDQQRQSMTLMLDALCTLRCLSLHPVALSSMRACVNAPTIIARAKYCWEKNCGSDGIGMGTALPDDKDTDMNMDDDAEHAKDEGEAGGRHRAEEAYEHCEELLSLLPSCNSVNKSMISGQL